MRQLRIAKKTETLPPLQGVDEVYRFVELIARKYAKSPEQLKQLYLVGVDAANAFKEQVPERKYNSKVAWAVEQKIKYSV